MTVRNCCQCCHGQLSGPCKGGACSRRIDGGTGPCCVMQAGCCSPPCGGISGTSYLHGSRAGMVAGSYFSCGHGCIGGCTSGLCRSCCGPACG